MRQYFLQLMYVGLTVLCVFHSSAYAQSTNQSNIGVPLRGSFLRPAKYATQSELALFVDAALGSDDNACESSGAGACATFQGACDKIQAMRIRHPVTITAAAGTYSAGCYLYDLQFDPADPVVGAPIIIQGTLINATLATGSATGTTTAATTGSSATTAWGTATDAAQTWTVDNLRGLLAVFTSGAGSGQILNRPIVSNTATVMTFAGSSLNGASTGTTYAIQDWGTIINGTLTFPTTPFAAGSSATASAFILSGTAENFGTNNNIIIKNIRFTATTGRAITQRSDTGITIGNCKFNTASNSNRITAASGSGTLAISGSVFQVPSGSGANSALSITGSGGIVAFSNSICEQSDASAICLDVQNRQLTIAGSDFKLPSGSTRAIRITDGQNSILQGMRVDCNNIGSSVGLGVSPSASTTGGTHSSIFIDGSEFKNCVIACLQETGPAYVKFGTSAVAAGQFHFNNCGSGGIPEPTGSGAIQLYQGASAEVNSSLTFNANFADIYVGSLATDTGTVNYSIATLRALTPKVISDQDFDAQIMEIP